MADLAASDQPRATLATMSAHAVLPTAPVARDRTVHLSRTMMLAEAEVLFDTLPPTADRAAYRSAIVDENVLLKRTMANREKTWRYLHQLYGLDRTDPLFVMIRQLWAHESSDRALLALLNAAYRDEILGASVEVVLATPIDGVVTSAALSTATAEAFPGRFGTKSLESIGRNLVSTWAAGGCLEGRRPMRRMRVRPSLTAATLALFLGWLDGTRGLGLFETQWAQLSGATPAELDTYAFAASNRDWLRYKRLGSVVEIDFTDFLARLQEGPRG